MSAARYDSDVDAATILVDMVRIRPVAFDLTNRAVGVTVLAVTDCSYVVEEWRWDVQRQPRFGCGAF
jgi:hypothetical protein